MKNLATIAAFAAGANALVGRSSTCCFHLTAAGGIPGTLGQLSDGQNRILGGLPPAQYCIDSAGAVKDTNGRGCILTGKTCFHVLASYELYPLANYHCYRPYYSVAV